MRETQGVLRIDSQAESESSPDLRMTVEVSLFAPAAGYGLVTLRTQDDGQQTVQMRRLMRSVKLTGTESFLQENAPLAVLELERDAAKGVAGYHAPEPVDLLYADGLKYADLQFRGPAAGPLANSFLTQPAEPGRAELLPGIEPLLFGADGASAYNEID